MSKECLMPFMNDFSISEWHPCTIGYHIADELLEATNNEELISKVFRNEVILDKILENFSTAAMNQLRLRLVSKSFNSTVLHKVRTDHREVLILVSDDQYFQDSFETDDEDEESTYTIVINGQKVIKEGVASYFRFLKEAADVKVRKLTVDISCSLFDDGELHNDIMKILIGSDYKHVEEFIGMKQLCRFGCYECGQIAKRCKEYGPLQINVLREYINKPHHFETLEVEDMLLFDIGKKCIGFTESKVEAMKLLNDFINSKISCDRLLLILTNTFGSSRYAEIGGDGGRLSYSFPREVLDLMIVRWKVKTLKLVVEESRSNSQIFDYNGVFTKASFDVPFETQPVSKFTLESVEVDLLCNSTIFEEMKRFLKSNELSSFDNLIANLRRIFPSKNMIVRFPKSYHLITAENLDIFILKVMEMADKESQRNSNLTFQIFPQNSMMFSQNFLRRSSPLMDCRTVNIPDILNSGACLLNENPSDCWFLDKIISIPAKSLKNYSGDVTVWNGKRFSLSNQMTNSSLNFEIIFERKFLKEFFEVRDGVKHSGFLRHFWELVN